MAFRKKSRTEELPIWETIAPVEFTPTAGDASAQQSLLIQARQSPGFPVAGGMVALGLASRASHILYDFTQQAVGIRYQIDGLWEQAPPIDRESGDAMLVALKALCGLNPAERRRPQAGSMGFKRGREKYTLRLQSQGVPTGERVLVQIEPKEMPFKRLEELGMREKMIQSYREALNGSGGLVLVSAPKGQGLTTTWLVSLEASDRFMRDFQAIEDKQKPEPETININANYYDLQEGPAPAELLRKMILKEPDVFVLPEIPDDDAILLPCDQARKNDKHILTRLVAGDAVEAAVRLVAKHKKAAKEIAEILQVVLNQRLARRLCEDCRVGFQPTPQMLQKLGIPPGRVSLLYRPFVPPPIEEQVDEKGRPAPIEPCPTCGGRGYFGRFAIFELLSVGPQLRAALLKTQDLNKLRQIAQQEGHRTLQQEALLAVARGITGLDELKRVFSGK